ncbi:MAG: TetR/AcrR family transcriptional regulator [Endozoicomonas sp.]|uniref:TetR/AcrR family transcriptional regulator n=1 Tax=Endozoicomonas sp. TaxID=1892382 RepID=UPI003D9BC95F
MVDKRALLTETALQLFYKKGINSVGINEVLQVSGVAKKTLYNHFASKDALILATLTARDEVFINWISEQLDQAMNHNEVVDRLFLSLSNWFNDKVPELTPFKGCFFINASAECSPHSDEVAQYCRKHKSKVRETIRSKLPGYSDEIIDGLCLLKEGAIATAFVSGDKKAADKCLPLALKLIQ